MPNTAIKKVSIQNSASTFDTRDFGAEAQDIDVSYDSNGDIIEDITAVGVVIAETGKLTTALKEAQTALAGKASATALVSKASLVNGKIPMSLLPDYVDDVIEGYYNTGDGKFYREDTYQTEIEGQAGKIYVDLNTNAMYRWGGSVFVEIINLSELDIEDLSDVDVNSLQDGQALVYDSNAQKWVNGSAALHIIQKPTVTVGTYTYNGQPQGPTIVKSADFDTYVETENATAVNAGTYTLRFKLKNTQTDRWNDLTTEDIIYTYTINKAAGNVTLSKHAVILTPSQTSDTVITSNATGTITVTSGDTGIVTVGYENDLITITSVDNGLTEVTVNIAASDNYLAGSKTIEVDVTSTILASWDIASDAQVIAMIEGYYSGNLSLSDIQSVWSVGQEREISLSAMTGGDITNTEVSGVTNTLTAEAHRAQTVKMVILDFDHDELTTAQGGKTKALVTLGQKDCLRDATVTDEQGSSNTENGKMNNSNTNLGGWKGCPRRTWCNNGYYNALPSYLKTLVKQVNKLSSEGNKSTNIITTQDKCWLASEIEIFGTKTFSANGEGTQYLYYTTASNRYKLPKLSSSSVSDSWWERSPRASGATNFCNVSNNGNADGHVASIAYGIAPSYCL